MTAARAAASQRSEAEGEARHARKQMKDTLHGVTVDGLEGKIAAAQVRVASYIIARPAGPPLPVDTDVARAAAEQAGRNLATYE